MAQSVEIDSRELMPFQKTFIGFPDTTMCFRFLRVPDDKSGSIRGFTADVLECFAEYGKQGDLPEALFAILLKFLPQRYDKKGTLAKKNAPAGKARARPLLR